MRTFQLTHTIDCDADTFWKVFFDPEFNTTMFLQELGFPAFEIVETRHTETEIYRKVRGRPKTTAPKAVTKLMGDSFGYSEEGRMAPGSNLWTFKITANSMTDKLTNEGTIRIEPTGDGKVKRIADLRIEARVFGVGSMIESAVEKDYRDGWDRSAAFMNRWVREHPAQ